MTEELDAVKRDIETFGALASLADSEGGRHLVKTFSTDLNSTVEALASQFATLPETELRAQLAKANHLINTLKAIKNAPQNYTDAKEYAQTLE